MTLRLLDLFSGIGGFSYAAEHLVGGFKTVQFVERELFCHKILSRHFPGVPIHDDICTFNPQHGSADVVCGGFPCQDISVAGKQVGIAEGTRSGLFYELMRVVRMVGPQFIVLENVAAITSNGMDIVLGTLAEAGFDAEWACIPAADLGACHRRDRWWCVAYAQGGRRRAGPGQGASQAGYQGPRTGNGGAGSDVADPARMLSNGQPAGHGGQSGGRAVTESGDSNGAAVTHPHPHRHRHRLEGQNELAGGRQEWPATLARLNPDWRRYLSKPVLCRGDDGLSGRVDRLKALGNAVVPQVAAIPLARVLELEHARAFG